MKKFIFLVLILIMLPINSIGAVPDPSAVYCNTLYPNQNEYRENCISSGDDDCNNKCFFSDTENCGLWDFYRGLCGQEYSYCEQQGGTIENRIENMGTWVGTYAVCVYSDGTECKEYDNIDSKCSTKSATDAKIYIKNNEYVYYKCPGGHIAAPDSLGIDIESTEIIDDRFFIDKNNVYVATADSHSQICSFYTVSSADPNTFEVINNYYQKDKNNVYKSDNYWGWGAPRKIDSADVGSFQVLSNEYAKDKYRAYYAGDTSLAKIENVDTETFEVLSEDNNYAMDKNNMYYRGEILGKKGEQVRNRSMYQKLKGKIILKVESNGEAYYVHPSKQEMYFLSRPVIAFQVMREQGIGITNSDLEKIPVADNYCPSYSPGCDNTSAHDYDFTNSQKGKIFLQVEKNGEAWYVNPSDGKRYFLGRPADAYNVMRNLGLGISNGNFESLLR